MKSRGKAEAGTAPKSAVWPFEVLNTGKTATKTLETAPEPLNHDTEDLPYDQASVTTATVGGGCPCLMGVRLWHMALNTGPEGKATSEQKHAGPLWGFTVSLSLPQVQGEAY